MLGFYVHTHWGYNRPYAARSWTIEDWDGYLSGLKALGYDLLLFWPLLDSMPVRATPSDREWLQRLQQVITIARQKYAMKTIACMNSNVIGNEEAARYPFQDRPYFSTEIKLNPADQAHLDILDDHLRDKFGYLKEVDGISLIDSDPGGFVGSTNDEFVELVHRKMLVMREFRANLELNYWMHVGWENYNRFWEEARTWEDSNTHPPLHWTTKTFIETLEGIREKVPEPWGLFVSHHAHVEATKALNLEDKQLQLSYGVVEGEPSFPLTNYNPAFMNQWTNQYFVEDHASRFPRGIMGNAQTHCVQLPHTYLFALNAKQGGVEGANLLGFAKELLPQQAQIIADSWQILEDGIPAEQRRLAGQLHNIADDHHETGPLRGLLFGDPGRFLRDLAMNLEVRAAMAEVAAANDDRSQIRKCLKAFIRPFKTWQQQLGFRDAYGSAGALYDSINLQAAKLQLSEVDRVLQDFSNWAQPSVRDGLTEKLISVLEESL